MQDTELVLGELQEGVLFYFPGPKGWDGNGKDANRVLRAGPDTISTERQVLDISPRSFAAKAITFVKLAPEGAKIGDTISN